MGRAGCGLSPAPGLGVAGLEEVVCVPMRLRAVVVMVTTVLS